jgi:hypothetical protein
MDQRKTFYLNKKIKLIITKLKAQQNKLLFEDCHKLMREKLYSLKLTIKETL